MFRTAVIGAALVFGAGAAAHAAPSTFDRLPFAATEAPSSRPWLHVEDDAPRGEWKLLGPAFSYHFESHHAPVRQAARWHECAAGADAAALVAEGCYLAVDGRYYKVDAEQKRGWVQNNPALGLSWTRRADGHAVSWSAGLVTDSFGQLGAIGLAAYLWPLHAGALRVDAGVAGGLWYRTQVDQGPRTVVPVAMPVLTLTHAASGFGIDVGLAPRFTINGRGNVVDAVMLQTTWAF
ncbi:MAG TPA: hypothetical protein VLU41_02000 [Ideonella sp.]|nr:hypothetical protein [Ideonella sp.]